MKLYIFPSNKDASRFVLEVVALTEIRNFDFKSNFVKIYDSVPQYFDEKIKIYGGKEKSATK